MSHDRFRLRVPQHSLTWFPAGVPVEAISGDTLLVRHDTLWAAAISSGQRAMEITEPELRDFTWADHCAKVRGHVDGDVGVSEMGPHGYERRPLGAYDAHLVCRVRWMVDAAAIARSLLYDMSFKDVDYGWFEYLSEVLDGLTDAKFVGSWGDATICSGHVTMVDMSLGLFPDRPPNAVVPAHIALWTGAKQ